MKTRFPQSLEGWSNQLFACSLGYILICAVINFVTFAASAAPFSSPTYIVMYEVYVYLCFIWQSIISLYVQIC